MFTPPCLSGLATVVRASNLPLQRAGSGASTAATLARRTVLAPCLLLLFACSAPTFTAAQAPAKAPTIASITLERGCFGCATGTSLTLRRNGPSSVTQTGNARHGTPTVTRQGAIAAVDFDALARLLDAKGFFTMAPSYEDPQLQDGAWSTITVVRDGQEKQVFSRADAAPAQLLDITRAIEALGARIDGQGTGR